MTDAIIDPISQNPLNKSRVLDWDLLNNEQFDKIKIFFEKTKDIDGKYTDKIFLVLLSAVPKRKTTLIKLIDLQYTPVSLYVGKAYISTLGKYSDVDPVILVNLIEICYRYGQSHSIRDVLEKTIEESTNTQLIRYLFYKIINYEKDLYYLEKLVQKFVRRLPEHTVLKYIYAELDSRILAARMLTKVPPITRAVFTALPEEFRFSVLDGGATASEIEKQFGDWPKNRWQVFGFDPHPDANLESDEGANVRMIRTGLGGKVGTAVLNHSRVDGASSLLEANIDYTRHLRYANGKPLSDIMETVGQSTIEIVDLDTWRTENGVGRFDFIKLNVQGAEKEIIEGAPETFDACMGIQTEVALAPVYKDAPMFRDIDGLMDRIGMTFFDMRKPNTAGRMSRKLNINPGSRSGDFRWPSRQITEAHVLYLRDPFRPEEQGSPRWQDPEAWLRLAIVAELNGQIEFAAQLCETVRDRFPDWIGDKLQAFDKAFDEAMVTYRDMINRHF
jgi:FkbM family methyltransferase